MSFYDRNGIAYYVAAGIPVVRDAFGLSWPADSVVQAIAWLLVATTLLSMTERAVVLARLRRRRRDAAAPRGAGGSSGPSG